MICRNLATVIGIAAMVVTCGCGDRVPEQRSRDSVVAAEDGVEIHYVAAGLEHAGPVLFFVHGWSNNWSFAQPRLDRMSASHPVVAMDLAGFGASGHERTDWSIESLGADVRSVIQELGLKKVVLIGHSMGGAVSLAAADLMPERVVGVVTVDWLQDPHQKYDEAFFQAYRSAYAQGFRDPDYVRAVGFSPNSPESNVMRYIENMPPEVPEHWWLILHAAFEWASDRLVPTLGRLKVPILAINTDSQPTEVEAYRELVTSFEARIVGGKGHIGILWEDPETLDSYLTEFMDSLE